MAMLALPALGAALGAASGIVGAASWGWMIGSMLYSLTSGPRKGRPSIRETAAQTVQEGAPINIVYGTAPVTGNVIACGPVRKVETPIKQGKGGSKTVGTDVQYFCTYAIALAEGPLELVNGIVVAKRDGKIVFDARPGSGMEADNQAFLSRCSIYLGTATQMPDAALEAIYGAGEVPAYRGTAYIVFRDDDLTQRSGSLPQWEFVIGNGYVPPIVPDNRESRLVSVVAAQNLGGVQSFPGENSEDTGQPTWNSYFSEFIGVGAHRFIGYDGTSAPGDTGFVADKVLPIDPSREYFLFANNSYDMNDITAFRLDFLNANGATVAVLRSQGYVGPPEDVSHFGSAHYLWYGPSIGSMTRADVSGRHQTNGTISFEDGLLRFVSTHTGNSNQSFDLACDALSIRSVKASSCRSVSHYTAGLGTGNARVILRRLPVDFTPPVVEDVPQGNARLSDIVIDAHARCGAAVPDVSELEEIYVKGLVLASPEYSGASVIDTLRGMYFFDRMEAGGTIKYIKRGKTAVASISEGDLVDVAESTEREATAEYPRKLLLTAISTSANYETSTVASQRYSADVKVTGEGNMSVPVVLDEQEQTTLAAIMHKILWVEAEGEVNFSLPFRWINLAPSDCVTLSFRGQSRRIRIEEISDAEFVRTVKGRVDRISAYTANPTFVPLTPPQPPISSLPGDSTLAVLDVPALVEQDDSLLYYVAVAGDRPAWPGALVQRSLDQGASFSDVAPLGAAVVGRLLDAVFDSPEHYTDTTNQVRVQLVRAGQELDPVSEAAFLNEGGAFALQKPDGSWELMQYLDAQSLGSDIFLLSVLHRGILNSGTSEHFGGALFVLLQGVTAVPAQSLWLGATLTHRAPSIGQSAEEADQQALVYAGKSQREWSVVFLQVRRLGDTLSGEWLPRHRFGSDLQPIASSNFSGYRVSLEDGANTHMLDVTDPAFSFDATGWSWPITVTVQALNRITGPGESATAEAS